VALPAFTAERRAAAPLLLSAPAADAASAAVDRYPAGRLAANPPVTAAAVD